MSVKGPVAVVCLAATAGLMFASVSTLDFVAHLDRQVHDLHCSFVPGLTEAVAEGSEGCKATLMSPYSSVFRRSMWGGIPISLPAMAVFAFILYRAVEFFGRPESQRRPAATALLLAALVPAAASAVMGWIAYAELGAACKLCIGIYVSSAVTLIGALWAWGAARAQPAIGSLSEPPAGPASPTAGGTIVALAAAQLVGFVLLPVAVYKMMAPDFSEFIGSCGQFDEVEDPYGVLVPLDSNTGGAPTVEVLDPMCPACRAFEERLAASGLEPELHRVALLFPLDSTCNWMISTSLHPGACAVSEAALCAHRQGLSPNEVLAWAFANQEDLLAAEKRNPGTVAERVAARFPNLRACLGSAEVQADLNKSLRWAVTHELPVMTPQLYVGGTKLCDEDTDLGVEWALTEILHRQAQGKLPRVDIVRSAVAPPEPPVERPRTGTSTANRKAAPKAKTPAPESGAPHPAPAQAPKEPPTEAPDEPAAESGAAPPGALPSVEELPPPAPEDGADAAGGEP